MIGCVAFTNWYRQSSWRKWSVFCQFPSKARGSFPWRDSSSPRIRFGRGPGDGPLVGGEGGVGGRGGDGPRGGGGEGDRFGPLK